MVLAGMLKDWIEKDKKAQQAKDYAQGVEVGRAEGVAVGRAEGVAEGSAAMKAYYERKIAALERGEPFDEPPPDPSEL